MAEKWLTALPVYNEAQHVNRVLDEVLRYSNDVLVVDDGSTDTTSELLSARKDIRLASHATNQGYGAALLTAFEYAAAHEFDGIVTIDCDGQHEPQRIPRFVAACAPGIDIVSGSRYLKNYAGDDEAPAQRRYINQRVTAELNRRLCFALTDAFCGFKAYRVSAVQKLKVEEKGYAMPLELWVQAAYAGLKIVELPVPRIYLDEKRSFGGSLDNASVRLQYYQQVLDRAIAAAESQWGPLTERRRCGDAVG